MKKITRSTFDTICQFSFSVLNFLLTDHNASLAELFGNRPLFHYLVTLFSFNRKN